MYPDIETKADYAEYQAAVERGCQGLEAISTGACPGCVECGLDEDCSEDERELAGEAWFSWRRCDICSRALGGNREPGHAILDGQMIHFDVCVDCVYYLEYGHLDDMTMLQIGE